MTDDPRLDPHHDARLSRLITGLISEAADSVEPGEGLTAIRSRTRSSKEPTMSTSRTWLAGVAGAAVGTAAVITAVAVISHGNGDSSTPAAGGGSTTSPTQSSQPTQSTQPTQSGTDTPTTPSATGGPIEAAVPVYFAGDGPKGTVLYREFEPGTGADPVAQAASAAVSGTPLDPDYRSLWPQGTQATASYDGDTITVDLSGPSVHDLPSGMSQQDAALAVQQVVYSVQGAAQARAGVQFLIGGQHTDAVLGEPASEPLTNAPVLKTLSQMSISEPSEGQSVTGTLTASGVNNSFEATVAWEIQDGSGKVVLHGAGIADGYGDHLYPWKLDPIDVSGLAPGTYTFVARNDDPSGGEGKGPDSDSRTFVVQ